MRKALLIVGLLALFAAATARAEVECTEVLDQRLVDWLDQAGPGQDAEAMHIYADCLKGTLDRSLQILYNDIESHRRRSFGRNFLGIYYDTESMHSSMLSAIESVCHNQGPPESYEYGRCLFDGYAAIHFYYRRLGLFVKSL